MKAHKLFLLPILIFSCSLFAKSNEDPVLMTINGDPITKSEFEYIYNKNNSTNSLDKKTLDEYVDLFINFKLKVEEAKVQGIDTTAEFKREYRKYRSQLTSPYLIDKKAEENIIKQAYNRMQEEREVSHIYIRMPQQPSAADTLVAWEKISTAHKRLKKEDFGKVAKDLSDDASTADKGGYIGWVSAFIYMYTYETKIYTTPESSYSQPFRTQVGYHIVKVHQKRPSRGEVRTAHIMTFTGKDNEKNIEAKHKIDSIYQLILNGDNFEKLAKENSEDRGSAMHGGEMPWIGIGRMPIAYEQTAYALEIGEISKPVQSSDGWHIIKLLAKKDLAPFEELKAEIKQNIQHDERSSTGRDSLAAKLKIEYNFQYNKENLGEFAQLLDGKDIKDSVFHAQILLLNKPLFSIGDKPYTQNDFAKFIKKRAFTRKTIPSEIIENKFNDYITEEIILYEDSKLESKHQNLRLLSQEYYDGILLFEISNREVWEKAAKDTIGLTNFFNEHKSEYLWEVPHYKGRVIYAKDKKKLKEAKAILSNTPEELIDRQLQRLNDSIIYIKSEKGLFVQGDNKVIDEKTFKSGVKHDDKDFPYVYLKGKMLNHTPESYIDVRGPLTADYQTYMEQEWIKSLRQKYPYSVNQEVLKTVKKN